MSVQRGPQGTPLLQINSNNETTIHKPPHLLIYQTAPIVNFSSSNKKLSAKSLAGEK